MKSLALDNLVDDFAKTANASLSAAGVTAQTNLAYCCSTVANTPRDKRML